MFIQVRHTKDALGVRICDVQKLRTSKSGGPPVQVVQNVTYTETVGVTCLNVLIQEQRTGHRNFFPHKS